MIETKEITVKIGLKRPYNFMHISDAHVAIDDEARTRFWTPASGELPKDSIRELFEYADKEKLDCIFMTGDAVDYFHAKHIAFLENLFTETKTDVLYAYGNHEGINENGKFYGEYINLMGEAPDFIVRDYEEFSVVAIDDSDVNVTASQVEKLKEKIKEGRPLILIMHVPIENDDMTPWIMEHWDGNFLIGKEEDSDSTKEFCRIVKNEPLVKAVFAGHIHYSLEGNLSADKKEYTISPAFLKTCNIIRVI